MYPVSDAFKRAVTTDHKLATICEVYDGSDLLATLPITGGSANIDASAVNKRRCTVNLNGEEWVPKELEGLLHTNSGHEIRPYRGVVLPDGSTELVPQGVFNIEDCDIEDSGEDLTVTVKGFDRSKEIQRRRFTDLYFIDAGTNYGTAIRDLLESRWPGLKYNFPAIEHTTPSMVLGEGGWSGGGDPWVKAQEMASDIGMELSFNVDGSVSLRPVADPKEDPVVADYVEGPESTLLYVTRSITRENVFNHVVVVGNHSGLFVPIRAHAVDDDPLSPTFIDTYGDVPTFHRSTNIFTQAQGDDVAQSELLKTLGTPENVRFISVVNPAHDTGDVVNIVRERAGVNSTYVLDKLNIPFMFSGSINATARERRVRAL